MAEARKPRRTRVERGIYRQPNGEYAICTAHGGVLRFRMAPTNSYSWTAYQAFAMPTFGPS
jgi:hypothetical protein